MLKVSLGQRHLFMLLYQSQNLLDTEINSFVWNIVTGVCLYLDTVQHISQGMWRGCITENKRWTHSHAHLFFFFLEQRIMMLTKYVLKMAHVPHSVMSF